MRLGQSTACPAYCDKCGQPIEGNAVYMDTRWYHSSCFSFVEGAKKRDADVERLTAERDALRELLVTLRGVVELVGCSGEGYDEQISERDKAIDAIDAALLGEGE